jgi:outer membrane protein TolC
MNRNLLIITTAFLLLNSLYTVAQPGSTKAKEEIQPAGSYRKPADSLIEAKLAELALNSPTFRASNHQQKIQELELRKAKNAWLNLLSVSYNVNDQTFRKSNDPTAVTNIYPKYNAGIVLPLGIIFSQGTQVKTAKETLSFNKEMQEVLSRSIKAEVISKYREYSKYNKLIEMQSELINDVLANATQAEEDFKKGTKTVQEYIAAMKTKNEELAKNMDLRLQQDLVKLEIEKIIGIPLEQVLNPPPAPSK